MVVVVVVVLTFDVLEHAITAPQARRAVPHIVLVLSGGALLAPSLGLEHAGRRGVGPLAAGARPVAGGTPGQRLVLPDRAVGAPTGGHKLVVVVVAVMVVVVMAVMVVVRVVYSSTVCECVCVRV